MSEEPIGEDDDNEDDDDNGMDVDELLDDDIDDDFEEKGIIKNLKKSIKIADAKIPVSTMPDSGLTPLIPKAPVLITGVLLPP